MNRERQKEAQRNTYLLLKDRYGVMCEFDDGFTHVIFESDSKSDCRKYLRGIMKGNPDALVSNKGTRLDIMGVDIAYYIINKW